MMNWKAMKCGINVITSLGWICVFVSIFMLLGATESARDDSFRKTGVITLVTGLYILAPGTLIEIGSTILRLVNRKRGTK
jgi:hypothetical protein